MVDVWRYPLQWTILSRQIRERDANRCRWCGSGDRLFDLKTGEPIRLTTMHLDGDSWNCESWNLVTACRSCHTAYDAPYLSTSRAMARYWRLIAAGQLELFPFQGDIVEGEGYGQAGTVRVSSCCQTSPSLTTASIKRIKKAL